MTRPYGGPGFAVVERVQQTVERYRLAATGDTFVVAVSGGPDSTCLLDVLGRIATRLEFTLHVAHVDHGLSEGSDALAARVATAAAESGFEVHVVRAPDLSGPNLHARARAFRYGFFETVARQVGADAIATGHTLDDRVETTLARLVHGAPPEVLAGIRPRNGDRIHPLLELRRAETRAYCEEAGLEFYDDAANEDSRFERARVRTHLVAAIEEHFGEGAVRAVADAARRLGEDATALDDLASRLHAELARASEEGTTFPRDAFEGLPRALQRRLLGRAVGRVRDRTGGIEDALDALDRAPDSGARFAVAGGAEIVLERDRIVVTGTGADDEE